MKKGDIIYFVKHENTEINELKVDTFTIHDGVREECYFDVLTFKKDDYYDTFHRIRFNDEGKCMTLFGVMCRNALIAKEVSLNNNIEISKEVQNFIKQKTCIMSPEDYEVFKGNLISLL